MIAIVLTLWVTTHDAAALARTAPAYLHAESARDHLMAARLAAAEWRVDADLLLSIAHHESRYQERTRTPEVGGRVSCGVMTPEPLPRCGDTGLLAGYRAGAEHLRDWYNACAQNQRCALTGYAGGWRLIKSCAGGSRARACGTPDDFLRRARWIRAERTRER